MANAVSVLGLITARGGSKGIPRKNIADLRGRPLIAYTIESASKSRFLTRTIVSTDDEEIASIARGLGADVPFLRPAELATDEAKSADVAAHALLWIKGNNEQEFDYVMLLQPTSPLRTAEDIDACIQKVADTDADSVLSMVELTDMSLPKLKKIRGDRILPLLEDEGSMPTPRQESEPIYKRNTAIYLTKSHLILEGDVFGRVSRPYIMPMQRSVDINEPSDLDLADFYMQKQRGS